MSGVMLMLVGGKGGEAPANTVAPALSDSTPVYNQTISTTTGTWDSITTPSYAYQWQRSASNIGGATSSSYTIVGADVSNTVRCVVTATNPFGSTAANSNTSSTVVGTVPGAPTIGTATAGVGQATVAFTPPASLGYPTSPITYTATSTPGSLTATGASSPLAVTGLTTGVSYTFRVTATNPTGTGSLSAASNAVEPLANYKLYMTGLNNDGVLGQSNTVYTSSPVQVATDIWSNGGINPVNRVALVTKTNGELWTWGAGNWGLQARNNTYISVSSPVQSGALTTWSNVWVGGASTTMAVKNNGTLWVWGRNTLWGLFGNSTTSATYAAASSPIQIGALTWKLANANAAHAMAIKTDGTLWAWGSNSQGRLGINQAQTAYKSSPVQVGGLNSWRDAHALNDSTVAIRTNNTVWAWGNLSQGEGGNDNLTPRSSPVQVGALTTWSKISGGKNYVMAIKTDGTLWGWGRQSEHGNIGDGTKISHSSPVQIGALTNWATIATNEGSEVTAGIDTSGRMWTWGRNEFGALGINNYISKSSPVQVGSLTTWGDVSTSIYNIAFFEEA